MPVYADRVQIGDQTGVESRTKHLMHVGISAGVVSSRKVAMAALPHGLYGLLVLDTVGLSVSFGVIGHVLSINCTCFPE
jgi:hypothetical protein